MLHKRFDDCRGQHDTHPKWYKFDDGDVMECKMDDDEVKKLIYNALLFWLVGWFISPLSSSFPLLTSACRCEQS